MAERKTPVRLTRGPLTGGVFALTNYKVVRRPGLADWYEARADGKRDVTADFDALALEELIGNHASDIAEILDGVAKGWYSDDNPMPEHEQLQVRAFRKALVTMIERHNARTGGEHSRVLS